MADIPSHIEALTKAKRAAFQAWLDARGAAALGITNPYEVMRFTARVGVGIIYRNDAGRLRWTQPAIDAWLAFTSNASHDEYRVVERGERIKGGSKRRQVVDALVHRDGAMCACCGEWMAPRDRTIEHFTTVAKGGSRNINNLLLMHAACNQKLADLNPRAKLELIILARGRASAQQCETTHQRNTETERDERQHDGGMAACGVPTGGPGSE